MSRNACRQWRKKKVDALSRIFSLMILNSVLSKSQRFWSGVSILVLLVSFGCSTAAPPPAVVTEIVELPDPTPSIPYPQPLSLELYEWTVMAPGHWRDPEQVYFCLDPLGYEAAARNNGQLLRFTKEVMWQLRYYNEETDDGRVERSDESPDQ